jgi:eukaryotic-like serine/threonine-protein kinase
MPGGMPPRPPERKTSSWVMAVLAALGVLAVVALGVGLALSRNDNNNDPTGPTTVVMPKLIGLTDDEAKTELAKLNLTGNPGTPVETDDCPDTPVVAVQKPDANTEVPANQPVSYQLCRGPNEVTVPNNLVGSTRDAADSALRAIELKPDFVEVDDARQEGQVIKVDKAGQKVKPGTTIKVTLSRGNLIAVPNVIDRTQAEAELLLSTAGFDVKVLTSQRDGTPGTVIDQDPNANQQRKEGTTVTITVIAEPDPDPSGDPDPGGTDPPGNGGGIGGSTETPSAIRGILGLA